MLQSIKFWLFVLQLNNSKQEKKLAFEETFVNSETAENFTAEDLFDTLAGNEVVQSDLGKNLVVTDTKVEKVAIEKEDNEQRMKKSAVNDMFALNGLEDCKTLSDQDSEDEAKSGIQIQLLQDNIKTINNKLETNEAKLKLAKFDLSRVSVNDLLIHLADLFSHGDQYFCTYPCMSLRPSILISLLNIK